MKFLDFFCILATRLKLKSNLVQHKPINRDQFAVETNKYKF